MLPPLRSHLQPQSNIELAAAGLLRRWRFDVAARCAVRFRPAGFLVPDCWSCMMPDHRIRLSPGKLLRYHYAFIFGYTTTGCEEGLLNILLMSHCTDLTTSTNSIRSLEYTVYPLRT
jgi:hypothetical protein